VPAGTFTAWLKDHGESSFTFEDLDGILTVDSLTVLKIISVDLFHRFGSKKDEQIKLSLFPIPNRYFG